MPNTFYWTKFCCLYSLELLRKIYGFFLFFVCIFKAFLGQKHGYCPIPKKIPQKEFIAFEKAAAQMEREDELNCLKEWYRLDENAIEPEYVAYSVSEKYPGFLSEVNKFEL